MTIIDEKVVIGLLLVIVAMFAWISKYLSTPINGNIPSDIMRDQYKFYEKMKKAKDLQYFEDYKNGKRWWKFWWKRKKEVMK